MCGLHSKICYGIHLSSRDVLSVSVSFVLRPSSILYFPGGGPCSLLDTVEERLANICSESITMALEVNPEVYFILSVIKDVT